MQSGGCASWAPGVAAAGALAAAAALGYAGVTSEPAAGAGAHGEERRADVNASPGDGVAAQAAFEPEEAAPGRPTQRTPPSLSVSQCGSAETPAAAQAGSELTGGAGARDDREAHAGACSSEREAADAASMPEECQLAGDRPGCGARHTASNEEEGLGALPRARGQQRSSDSARGLPQCCTDTPRACAREPCEPAAQAVAPPVPLVGVRRAGLPHSAPASQHAAPPQQPTERPGSAPERRADAAPAGLAMPGSPAGSPAIAGYAAQELAEQNLCSQPGLASALPAACSANVKSRPDMAEPVPAPPGLSAHARKTAAPPLDAASPLSDVPSTPPHDPPERASSAPPRGEQRPPAHAGHENEQQGAEPYRSSASGAWQPPPPRPAASPLRRRLRRWRALREARLRAPSRAEARRMAGAAPASPASARASGSGGLGALWGGCASLLDSLATDDMAAPALLRASLAGARLRWGVDSAASAQQRAAAASPLQRSPAGDRPGRTTEGTSGLALLASSDMAALGPLRAPLAVGLLGSAASDAAGAAQLACEDAALPAALRPPMDTPVRWHRGALAGHAPGAACSRPERPRFQHAAQGPGACPPSTACAQGASAGAKARQGQDPPTAAATASAAAHAPPGGRLAPAGASPAPLGSCGPDILAAMAPANVSGGESNDADDGAPSGSVRVAFCSSAYGAVLTQAHHHRRASFAWPPAGAHAEYCVFYCFIFQ
jgi:hypothetical protein